MTRPPVGSTGTLAELQVELGDKYKHVRFGEICRAEIRYGELTNRNVRDGGWGISVACSDELYTLISRANPDHPSLQIEAGKYYRTRDGRKVGPMHYSSEPFGEGWSWFDPEGRNWAPHGEFGDTSEYTHENDLIAEWRDDQPAHIITHDGRTFDLTALEAPFGLLPEPVQVALQAWPHGVEMMAYSGQMIGYNFPDMKGKRGAVWRAKPVPTETRVDCYRGEQGVSREYGTCIKRPDGSIDWASFVPDVD